MRLYLFSVKSINGLGIILKQIKCISSCFQWEVMVLYFVNCWFYLITVKIQEYFKLLIHNQINLIIYRLITPCIQNHSSHFGLPGPIKLRWMGAMQAECKIKKKSAYSFPSLDLKLKCYSANYSILAPSA